MTEFGLIDSLRTMFSTLPDNGFEGIGDDCAVYPITDSEALVFTSDTLCEGVHFLRQGASASEIGGKSLMVNLSDVAAMGARPIATLLAISIPEDCTEEWIKEFTKGYHQVSKQYGVPLIGGDTTSSKHGITINITAIGRAPIHNIKRRSTALPGDKIFIGGALGGSAAGLRDILAGELHTQYASLHRNPQAQIHEGEWLGSQECVHAMMDISDGLASDLLHILKASEVGAEVETSLVPRESGCNIEDAVCGGEDYKLLFTVDNTKAEELCRAFAKQFGYEPIAIGQINSSQEHTISWKRDGELFYPDWRGFSHF